MWAGSTANEAGQLVGVRATSHAGFGLGDSSAATSVYPASSAGAAATGTTGQTTAASSNPASIVLPRPPSLPPPAPPAPAMPYPWDHHHLRHHEEVAVSHTFLIRLQEEVEEVWPAHSLWGVKDEARLSHHKHLEAMPCSTAASKEDNKAALVWSPAPEAAHAHVSKPSPNSGTAGTPPTPAQTPVGVGGAAGSTGGHQQQQQQQLQQQQQQQQLNNNHHSAAPNHSHHHHHHAHNHHHAHHPHGPSGSSSSALANNNNPTVVVDEDCGTHQQCAFQSVPITATDFGLVHYIRNLIFRNCILNVVIENGRSLTCLQTIYTCTYWHLRSHSVESLFTDDSKIAQDENTEDLSDYDPRINLAGKPHSAKKKPQTLIRPRYLSTELGIKEKNFVAVLSSIKQISTLGLAMNKTLAHHVNRLAFFVEVVGNDKLDVKTLPIVGFKDSQQDSGILISSSILLAISPLLETCTEDFAFNSDDEKIGLCIFKALNLTCQSQVQGQTFSTFNLDAHISDVRQLEKIWESQPALSNALTFFHARETSYFFMLNKQTCEVALRNIKNSIRDLESSILRLAPDAPGGLEAVTWPVGYSPPSKQDTRFSVLHWKYFNETHVFFDTENSVVKPLSGPNLEDIQEVISAAVKSVLKESPELSYLRVVSSYKRFDPTRGMDYRLHLLFKDPVKGKITVHNVKREKFNMDLFRMEGCRPITHVDTVPMPYVTESSVVHIVLVLREDDEIAPAERFISSFAKNMMAKSDKSELTLVLLNRDAGNFKSLAQTLNAQYKKQGSKISILSSKISSLNRSGMDFIAVDLISSKVEPGTLIFLCNPFTEIYPDVLNRVRINTISGWQLFSPIPFAEYNPEVSFPGLSKTEALNISTNQGFYDVHETQHISFYMADYLNARKTFEMEQPLVKSDRDLQGEFSSPHESILAMFTRMRQLHILRAVEPHLRIRYHERKCETRRCRESFLLSQGTRSQLAQFALDRESPALTE
ncbi:hypothetical protein DAPPUDRAFT_260261 [Daphnia pulex]|uniref:Hexosyltransferase n=1 Tax=Daphnia pulex TaxID=6669 RepID=E9HIU6_DAPPU|nr:hypothetical protein DAPPUDRAFT_260261 [Daphnia pulex]|eukprot:EFX68349.1 hypothetical protein DAPPUDRAFT_260261 [Daphnia pulex]